MNKLEAIVVIVVVSFILGIIGYADYNKQQCRILVKDKSADEIHRICG